MCHLNKIKYDPFLVRRFPLFIDFLTNHDKLLTMLCLERFKIHVKSLIAHTMVSSFIKASTITSKLLAFS